MLTRRTFTKSILGGAVATTFDWPMAAKAAPAATVIKLPRPLSAKELEHIVRTEVMRGYKWELVGDASRNCSMPTPRDNRLSDCDRTYACGGNYRCVAIPIGPA